MYQVLCESGKRSKLVNRVLISGLYFLMCIMPPSSASRSFHQLFAELTHNEMDDPSMTFHLPEQNVPKSPEEQPAGFHSSASESHEDSSQFELSPERLRIEEPVCCMTTFPGSHESFSQLIISQQHSHDSVLIMSPTMKTDVASAALNLSKLTMCDDSHGLSMAKLEEPFKDFSTGELKCELSLSLNNALTVSEKVMVRSSLQRSTQSSLRQDFIFVSLLCTHHLVLQEAAGEKGILEQSEITLVSLTDTTLQDPETTITEGAEWEDKHPDGKKEDRRKDQETQVTKTNTSFEGKTQELLWKVKGKKGEVPHHAKFTLPI